MNGRAPETPVSGGSRKNGEEICEEIVARLEEDIVLGRLHPKERLVEEEIALRFGVKRHVVRQAILGLERLGLVERFRNRGAVVRLYAAKEVEDFNAVREVLETHAAGTIPLPLGEDDLAELGRLQEIHGEAVAAGDKRKVFRSNVEFHRALFRHCGNAALIEAIAMFAQKSHAYRHILLDDKAYLAWTVAEHRKMVEALRRRDRETLVELCRAHLAPTTDYYIGAFRSRFAAE